MNSKDDEDRDRMLAEAWRDLAGWQPGMMDEHGRARCGTCTRPIDHDATLPALDSPANWGHWEDWCSQRGFTVEVSPSPYTHGAPVEGWLITVDGRSSAMGKTRGEALLAALCVGRGDLFGETYELPPSVLAWWKAEQEATK